jgi:diadenosine tetraphosphate (Ap4A) HIT family hydrolase
MTREAKLFSPQCKACGYVKGEPVPGGTVSLPGDWFLNHYRGTEGFLGWLALQPCEHRMSIRDVSEKEAKNLGWNIKLVDKFLGYYWENRFNDPVERLYIAYFFESAGSEPFHLHIHLIPRFRSIETRLRAWKIPDATKSATFPDRYRRDCKHFESEVELLMTFLRKQVSHSQSI